MTTGLNGTPMPAFGDALKPEERWAITDYMYSLGDGDDPHYANLITAKHVDDPIDLAKGAAAFEKAPVARIPIRTGRRSLSPGRSRERILPALRITTGSSTRASSARTSGPGAV